MKRLCELLIIDKSIIALLIIHRILITSISFKLVCLIVDDLSKTHEWPQLKVSNCYDKNKKFNIKNFWILDTTLILFMVPDPPKQEFIYSLLLVSL